MYTMLSAARRLALGAAVAALVAGCGGFSTTPKPLLDALKSQVTSGDFQYEGKIDGSMTMVVGSKSYDGTISGTSKGKGQDSASFTSIEIAGGTYTQDTITIGDSTYSRTNDSSWTKGAKSDSSLADLFRIGMKIEDKGVETKFGQQLHRVEPTNLLDLDLASIGVGTSTGVSNMEITLVFWVKNDGTPAGVTQGSTYDQDNSGTATHVTMTMDVVFTNLSGVTIEAPAT
jgi:hypothetical protein